MKTLVIFPNPSIVPHGNFVISKFSSFFCKEIKFYKIITKHVRVWGDSMLVSTVDMRYNSLLICFAVVKSKKWNIKEFRYLPRHFNIFPRWARSAIRKIIYHKTSMNFMSCFFQKKCRNGRINSSGESYKNFRHGCKLTISRVQFILPCFQSHP